MKKGKLFSRFSLIDVAVLLLIALILVVAAVRFGWFSTPEKAAQSTEDPQYQSVDCLVTLTFQKISSEVKRDDLFQPNATMYVGSKKFGSIVSFETMPYELQEALADGTTVTVKPKDAYNCNVTVKATLTQKNGMLYASGNQPIGVGQSLTFGSRYYSGKAFVTSVEKIQ